MKKLLYVLAIVGGALFVYMAIMLAPIMEQEANTFVKVFASVITVMVIHGFSLWAKKLAPESQNDRDDRLSLSDNLGKLNIFLSGRKGI